MRFVIFLVSLCCLLIKGDTGVYASTIRKDVNYSPTKEVPQHPKHTPKKQSANSNKTTPDYSAIEDITIESDNLINDDSEEDDLIKCLALKHKSTTRLQAANIGATSPSYFSFLNYHGKYFNAPPSLFGQVSYKYLVLGVFKI